MSVVLIINPVITYVIYETIKQKCKGYRMMAVVYLLSGAISKAIATLVTYPLFVLRARTQQHNISYYQLVKSIYFLNGLKAFYAGFYDFI